VDMDIPAARFFEDAGRRQLAFGILTTRPQQRRSGVQRRLEILRVSRGGIFVEQFLQRGSAEAGADQRCHGGGNRSAGQQDDAGDGQWREVFDLVCEARRQQFRLAPARLVRRGQRIVRGQN